MESGHQIPRAPNPTRQGTVAMMVVRASPAQICEGRKGGPLTAAPKQPTQQPCDDRTEGTKVHRATTMVARRCGSHGEVEHGGYGGMKDGDRSGET